MNIQMDEVNVKLNRAKRDLKFAYGLSAINAAVFSMNVACATFFPFSFWTILNVVCAIWMLRGFRGVVRHQIFVKSAIEQLEKLKKDNVWTPNK